MPDKQAAELLVSQVENVKIVVNELTLAPMTSTLSERSNDTYITGLVRAALLEAKDVPSAAYKVVTERSVVYLMGRVTEREAKRGAEVASGVRGVAKVVRSFELITDAEINTQTQPACQSACQLSHKAVLNSVCLEHTEGLTSPLSAQCLPLNWYSLPRTLVSLICKRKSLAESALRIASSKLIKCAS